MQKSYKGVKSEKCCEVATVGRRAARGGEVEVTELDQKWIWRDVIMFPSAVFLSRMSKKAKRQDSIEETTTISL